MALVKLNAIESASLVKVTSIAVAGISKIGGQVYSGGAPPSYEDLTTYTEVDENADITLTVPKCDVVTMRRDATSYAYYDYGVAYFGDFDVDFEFEITNIQDKSAHTVFSLGNVIGSASTVLFLDVGLSVTAYGNTSNLRLGIRDHASSNQDFYIDGGNSCNLMYCTFTRVGTTATLILYSDSGRTSVVDTLVVTCGTTTYRYLYTINAWGDTSGDSGDTMTAYTQNFEIITAS